MGMDEQEVVASIHELKAQMKFIVDTLTKLDAKFDRIYIDFVKKEVLDEKLKLINRDVEINKKEVDLLRHEFEVYKEEESKKKSEKRQSMPVWTQTVISFGSLIVAAIALIEVFVK